MTAKIEVLFWGCRGSVPASNANNLRYGANTTCFEIRSDALKSRVIIDAGTGINPLGQEIQKNDASELPIHIIYSHSHWDHIQGFPFFTPIYDPKRTIIVHHPPEQDYRDLLSKQMSPPFFPGTMDTAKANIQYKPYGEAPIVIEGISVAPYALRHSYDQRSRAFLVSPATGDGPRVALASDRQEIRDGSKDPIEERFNHDIHGLDVLIHDAFFTNEDFETHQEWGHSSIRFVVEQAHQVEAKTLCLHHYNPEYDDSEVDALIEEARKINGDHPMKITAAAEGESITLP